MGIIKYTPELEKDMIQQYVAGIPASQIAETLGSTERSIISKLSALGVYKKKEYLTKQGTKPVLKEEYVTELCRILNIDADFGESLGKVNKSILKMLVDRLK